MMSFMPGRGRSRMRPPVRRNHRPGPAAAAPVRAASILVASILVAAIFMVAGCSKGGAAGSGGKGGGRAGGFRMPPTPVEATAIHPAPIEDRFEAVGTFEAGEEITVVSEIDGTVVDIPFTEGAPVARGGVIARLDDAQLRAEADRAEALRDQQRASYNRVKAIVEQKAAAPQDLDDAAASLKVAEANLQVARAQLAKARIVAPFDGETGARKVSPGAFVRSGQALTSLAGLRELRVNFAAPERLLPLLKRGTEVRVSATAWPGYEVAGHIAVVEPVLDSGTRTVGVVALVPNPEERFRPGMSAGVSVVLGGMREAITVPSEAVVSQGDRSFVYQVKADSTVIQVPVELGLRLSDSVEVTKGLADGDVVITAGHQKVYQGAKVTPILSRPASSPGPGGSPNAGPGQNAAAPPAAEGSR